MNYVVFFSFIIALLPPKTALVNRFLKVLLYFFAITAHLDILRLYLFESSTFKNSNHIFLRIYFYQQVSNSLGFWTGKERISYKFSVFSPSNCSSTNTLFLDQNKNLPRATSVLYNDISSPTSQDSEYRRYVLLLYSKNRTVFWCFRVFFFKKTCQSLIFLSVIWLKFTVTTKLTFYTEKVFGKSKKQNLFSSFLFDCFYRTF